MRLPRMCAACALLLLIACPGWALERQAVDVLARQLQIGDVVFIEIPWLPFRKISEGTGTWTNHVGVVIDVVGDEPVVAESRVLRAGATPFSAFVARSAGGRVAVRRPHGSLTPAQNVAIVHAARQRFGVWYDTGFDLHSSRQFCSRYVYEVLKSATGRSIGEVQTFAQLLADQPAADQSFWKLWFLGGIPWQRKTITPASQLRSDELRTLFDGYVTPAIRS